MNRERVDRSKWGGGAGDGGMGRETGVKGAGDGGRGGGDGGRGGGGRELLYQNLLYFTDFLYFYVLQCDNWVSEVSNRRTEVNSGILTMNPALISLYRQGVFRQLWSTLTLFTSDFGLSLVDYFPLIPKITVASVAILTFRNNYPSAVDNRFICSLLDMEFCAVQKKKTKKKKTKKKQKKTSRSHRYVFQTRNRHVVRWGGWVRQRCRVSYVTEASN